MILRGTRGMTTQDDSRRKDRPMDSSCKSPTLPHISAPGRPQDRFIVGVGDDDETCINDAYSPAAAALEIGLRAQIMCRLSREAMEQVVERNRALLEAQLEAEERAAHEAEDPAETESRIGFAATAMCDLLIAVRERFEGERPIHRIAAEDCDEVMGEAKAALLERRRPCRLDVARPIAERVADWIGGWSVERMEVILDATLDMLEDVLERAGRQGDRSSSQVEQESKGGAK